MYISAIRASLLLFLVGGAVHSSYSNTAVWAPVPGGVLSTNNNSETNTLFPFLIKQAGLTNPPSMRYQQVYNASLFAGLDRDMYINQLRFILESQNPQHSGGQILWTIPTMQINLSTTSKTADTLSPVFNENVGPDDEVVLGPEPFNLGSTAPDNYLYFPSLERSFRYDPSRGNLLLDVRIFDGTGNFDINLPALEAFNSTTDTVSRVWSFNVSSSLAEKSDTIGLTTLFEFGPDFSITVPAPRGTELGTYYPFLIKQGYLDPTNTLLSMRYQQVYGSTLFTNNDSRLIYITSLTFLLESPYVNRGFFWTVTNLQVGLSTTTKDAGALSTVFGENEGSDRVTVFGPGTNLFQAVTPDGLLTINLLRPFRYDPTRGNLLLEVSLSELAGFGYTDLHDHYLVAFDSPTGLVSRVWSTNSMASVADGADALGLKTIIQFSPEPLLRARFFPLAFDGETNIIEISWPSQPSIFQLQETDHLGANTIWRSPTNQVFGSPQGGGRFIWIPVASASAQSQYRLIWPGGN